ncbi:hypothetical protein K1F50_17095 [Muricauda oceani]|uniref:hypothetical protein n=1 Tax=Flagellimonas oceani TaxID=2698672 RepID=UPI001C67A224|nr:hypothetical protein [Allomuricauda oceani]MBW8244527.1 hypothetical protein [Allomuricauda oceani]
MENSEVMWCAAKNELRQFEWSTFVDRIENRQPRISSRYLLTKGQATRPDKLLSYIS